MGNKIVVLVRRPITIVNISAKLLDNENTILFLILLYILLPSSTATTIV